MNPFAAPSFAHTNPRSEGRTYLESDKKENAFAQSRQITPRGSGSNTPNIPLPDLSNFHGTFAELNKNEPQFVKQSMQGNAVEEENSGIINERNNDNYVNLNSKIAKAILKKIHIVRDNDSINSSIFGCIAMLDGIKTLIIQDTKYNSADRNEKIRVNDMQQTAILKLHYFQNIAEGTIITSEDYAYLVHCALPACEQYSKTYNGTGMLLMQLCKDIISKVGSVTDINNQFHVYQ
jgi:hypothetical protein